MIVKKSIQDDAQVSVNKGKKPTICAFRRQRFAKLGIPRNDWERICSPFESQYSFETICETPIKITPLRDLPREMQEMIELAFYSGVIQSNQCYWNAVIIAADLNKIGYNVRCVEGYYDSYGIGWNKHRFNEYNGVFFDATAEYFVCDSIETIKYQGVRIYPVSEMKVIARAYSFLKDAPYGAFFDSTLPYNPNYKDCLDSLNEYCIDENGIMRYNSTAA